METDKFGFKVFIKDVPYTRHRILFESIFLSRVEGNIFFSTFFFLEKVIIDAINVIKTDKKNLKNKWRVNIF